MKRQEVDRKAGESQVEKNKNKKEKSPSLISLACGAAWQKVQQGQQEQSFKCSSVLAQTCVSALCGSTKILSPSATWRFRLNSRAHDNPLTTAVWIFYTHQLNSHKSYMVQCHEECIFKKKKNNNNTCLGCHAFSGFWDTRKRTEHRNILGDHCDICLIRVWSATHVHSLTLDIFCGMTKSRGEGGWGGNREEFVLPCGFGPFWGAWSHATSIPGPAFDMDGVHYVTESVVKK